MGIKGMRPGGMVPLAGLALIVATVVCMPHSDPHHKELGEFGGQQYVQTIADAVQHVHAQAANAESQAANAESAYHTQVHRVVKSVHHVWSDPKVLNTHFDAHMKKSHWHCRHCHEKCKTIHCRNWCHTKFCGEDYSKLLAAKNGVGRVGIEEGTPVIPQYVGAVDQANKALYAAEKSKTSQEFRQATRDLVKVKEEEKDDYTHFHGQVQREDAINAATFPSHREQETNDDENFQMEQQEADASSQRAFEDEEESQKTENQNASIKAEVEAKQQADGAMGDKDSMMSELATMSTAEDDALANDQSVGGNIEQHSGLAKVSEVSAELEAMGVKVKAARDSATHSSN